MSGPQITLCENPFCAARLRPGTIDYVFPADGDLTQLVGALRDNCWRGQIIGSHGSGKSTLLANLLEALRAQGHVVYETALHDGQSSRHTPAARTLASIGVSERADAVREQTSSLLKCLPHIDSGGRHTECACYCSCPTILAVDGYEQLSFWNRWSLRRQCFLRGLGLIVTAHAPAGLTTLARTEVDSVRAWQVAERLQSGHAPLFAAAICRPPLVDAAAICERHFLTFTISMKREWREFRKYSWTRRKRDATLRSHGLQSLFAAWMTIAFAGHCVAATLLVGPGKHYARPSQAIAAANPGDAIEIDASGNYAGDVATIRQNRLVVNNTMVYEFRRPSWFVRADNVAADFVPVIRNNLCVGPMPLTNCAHAVEAGNLIFKTTLEAGLSGAGQGDYTLSASSPAIGRGVTAGRAGDFELIPKFEYFHPAGSAPRPEKERIDVGAYAAKP